MPAVVLLDYDPTWPARFDAEATALRRVLGPVAVGIHHIGSTAVEGLVAKPIVDLLLVATALEALEARRQDLEREGFRWRGENGIPGRRYLDRPDPAAHVHAYATGHPEIARHLRFRDAIRGSAELRGAYATLKRSLAARHPEDRARYQDGKAAFIDRVLRAT